jgi:LemA protein
LSLAVSAILLLALAVLLVWGVVVYNGLVAARQECRRAWANIDVLLKQRHDELPRLVDICKGYMAYESETLQAVVAARARLGEAQSVPAIASASEKVSGAVRNLFAVVERYPDLKANESFLRLQTRISQLEDQIADRRELYNAAVTEWNTRIDQVPEIVLARATGMASQDLWHAVTADRETPRLSFG